MKKLLLLFAMVLMWGWSATSQTVLYEDNLDTYAVNSFLGIVNPTWWTTWSGAPGGGEDLQIKTNFAHTAPNSAVADKVGGQTDAILKLGDKTSGAYELKWWMYVETGKCGYYNIQHFQSPGIEWACELYFRTGGAIELFAGSSTATNGTYLKDQWFEVKHDIDLDKDSIWLYIDGVLLKKWKFSDQASQVGGTKQLGGVDFFAGEKSGSGEQPLYYIDDVSFIETTAGAVPIISATPTSVYKWLLGGSTGTETLTVNNTGTAPLTFTANVIYDLDKKKSTIATPSTIQYQTVKLSRSNMQAAPDHAPIPCPATDATAQLHYDGDNASAVGWNTPPVTVTVAARFPNSMTLPYAGLELKSVEVYVQDLNAAASNLMTLKIYGMGPNNYEPGALLYSQEFTPVATSWTTVTLTTPVMVTGEDLWVGYMFTQTDAGIYIPGTDGGPADPNGDFLSTGVGWSHLAPGIDRNWNIRANLEGTIFPHWLTVSPGNGTVAPAATKPLTLNFNTSNLTLGQYKADVKLLSNDNTNPMLTVPVTLDVVGVGFNDLEKTGVMVYPNPAKDRINIQTNGTLLGVTVSDLNGKTVYKGMNTSIDVTSFAKGIYIVKVETAQGTSNIKITKE